MFILGSTPVWGSESNDLGTHTLNLALRLLHLYYIIIIIISYLFMIIVLILVLVLIIYEFIIGLPADNVGVASLALPGNLHS